MSWHDVNGVAAAFAFILMAASLSQTYVVAPSDQPRTSRSKAPVIMTCTQLPDKPRQCRLMA